MTLKEFTKLEAEPVDCLTSDEGYRIEQYSVLINGECTSISRVNPSEIEIF